VDEPQRAAPPESDRITLSPDMRPVAATPEVTAARPAEPQTQRTRRSTAGRWAMVMGAGALALGLGALGLAFWTHSESQREILRLSTELAQLRVSLDLYARNGTQDADLSELGERVSTLERSAGAATVPMPAPASDAPAAAPATTAANADCLPVGMRLLVAAGDSYPICEQAAEVAVSAVDNGYITLGDGTSVASGGTMPLPGNPACTIAVTSGGDEGLTGYAEIRVSC